MATPIFDYARDLGNQACQFLPMTSGGAFAIGDPLVMSSGQVIKKTGGTDTVPVKFVAASAATAASQVVNCIPALATSVFRVTKSGSPVVGGQYGLTSSTLLVDGTNTTQKMVQVVGVDDADATVVYVVSIGWLA